MVPSDYIRNPLPFAKHPRYLLSATKFKQILDELLELPAKDITAPTLEKFFGFQMQALEEPHFGWMFSAKEYWHVILLDYGVPNYRLTMIDMYSYVTDDAKDNISMPSHTEVFGDWFCVDLIQFEKELKAKGWTVYRGNALDNGLGRLVGPYLQKDGKAILVSGIGPSQLPEHFKAPCIYQILLWSRI